MLDWLIDNHMDSPWQTLCHDRVERELRATEQWISTNGTLQAVLNENLSNDELLMRRKRVKCVVQ